MAIFDLTDEQLHRFTGLAFRMEPENLAADGERSAAEQKIEMARLTKAWNSLEHQCKAPSSPLKETSHSHPGQRRGVAFLF